MPSPSLKTNAHYTYGDYLTWTNEARWEIIEGVAYCMSPALTTAHQRISGALFSMIYNHVANKGCEVFSAPFDVRLGTPDISDDNWETVVQPDISVIAKYCGEPIQTNTTGRIKWINGSHTSSPPTGSAMPPEPQPSWPLSTKQIPGFISRSLQRFPPGSLRIPSGAASLITSC